MNYWTQSEKNIYVAAHRGWSEKYPENTMTAFKKAIEIGVDQIETDIRITKDRELVCIHDDSVDRTTNGIGKVCNMTLSELRTLDAGIKKGEEFAGERIPTFIEFMELVKDHPTLTLDIELKERPGNGNDEVSYDVCDRVLKIVDDYGFTDRVVINTFSGSLHEYIKDKYGDKYRRHIYYPIASLGKVTRDPYADGAYCCCMFRTVYSEINMATKAEFDMMRDFGIQPWAGAGVKDEKGVDMSIANGATLITCNNPDLILELLRAKGYHK
jgi:glycerophosphoryl diester phosphodiesterase